MDHGKVLVRNANGIELLSNVCRHRQAILLEGRGNAQNIVCPLHRWTYDMKGELLGAPHFPENPCLNLGKTPLQNWRGMLFAGKRDVARDLAGFASADDFDFSGYMLDRVEIMEFEQNWKTFIEVYLEDYHVIPYHPGLGNFVTCDDLKWDIADTYSAQVVGVKDGFAKPGTPTYAKWHDALTRYMAGRPAKQGAIWFLYYPNVMLEWYPHVLVVSTLLPRSPAHTPTSSSSTTRGHRPLRARIRRSRAGRLPRDRDRGRRNRQAHGPRPARPVGARRERSRALPVADGRRDDAFPRAHQARVGRAPLEIFGGRPRVR